MMHCRLRPVAALVQRRALQVHPTVRACAIVRHVRCASSTTGTATPAPKVSPRTSSSGSGVTMKAGAMFAGLSALAVALTVYGVWDYFSAFRVWPKELREPLRAAVKAQHAGKWERSAKNFRTALDIARTIDASRLGENALLKTTGISIALASVLEEQNKWQEAALVYVDALDEVLQPQAQGPESRMERQPVERMRGVALAQKIGELAQRKDVLVPVMQEGPTTVTTEPSESYLAWSVEEMMRLVQVSATHGPVHLDDLHLPSWVGRQDLGASVEALGAFYAGRNLAEYAVPLYVQAISMLLPKQAVSPPTVADRCRAAILMNNISQALTQSNTDVDTVQRAVAWATKGLDLASLASYRAGFLRELPADEVAWLLRFSGLDPDKVGPVAQTIETESDARLEQVKQQCLGTQFVLLYNLGMFYSMQKDPQTARTLFKRAMRQADRMKLREARAQCARAIARLDRDHV